MTHYIPNTKVQANILDPIPMDGYVPLFLNDQETGNGKNMGSVNAGTSNYGSVFAVGLGGINGAFASSLSSAGQNTTAYQQIHQNLYDQLSGTELTAFNASFNSSYPVQFSLIQKPQASYNLPGYDGIVFIDVFSSKQVPSGNGLNYSMIYVVPPNRSNYSDNAAFLKAVEVTCITMIEALTEYNSKHATPNTSSLEPINNIRMCLFSGGIYSGNTPQNDVALHNLLGLEKGLSGGAKLSGIDLVDFENSYDGNTQQNVFQSIASKLVTQS